MTANHIIAAVSRQGKSIFGTTSGISGFPGLTAETGVAGVTSHALPCPHHPAKNNNFKKKIEILEIVCPFYFLPDLKHFQISRFRPFFFF